jgi:hypothetical protein
LVREDRNNQKLPNSQDDQREYEKKTFLHRLFYPKKPHERGLGCANITFGIAMVFKKQGRIILQPMKESRVRISPVGPGFCLRPPSDFTATAPPCGSKNGFSQK